MASYLDKTGLTTLWGKVKSHVSSNYLALGGGTLSGDLAATGIQVNGEWPSYRWATADGSTVFVLLQANPSDNSLSFHLKRGGSNVWNSNECYSLPIPDLNQTATVSYNILTSKHAVTVAQGGTGSTTAAGARSALGITPANIGAAPTIHTHEGIYHEGGGSLTVSMNQTPIIWGRYNGITSWSLERNGSSTINCLSVHYYNSEGGWVTSGHILDHANFTTYVTPGAIGALPISGGTLTGSLIIPSNNKLTVHQVDFGSAYLYTDSNASFLGRTGPSTAYHYFQFSGSDGNLYIDGNKTLHAANYTSYTINRNGDTMNGALNFKNATLNKLGDDCAFGDQDIAGAFCIKGLNGVTTLALLPYEGSTTIKLSSGGGGWVSLGGATTFSVGREVMVNGDAYPVFTLSNGSGTALGAFGAYTGNGSYGNNYIRTYNSNGYHDYVFDAGGIFHSKKIIIENTDNPYIQINNGNGNYYLQGYLTNLYLGPGVSKGIAIDADGHVCRARDWTRFVSTVSWDGSTLILEDS